MNIIFNPLAESHFPLMLKWLESPHIKIWWDKDITYTKEKVKDKYLNYIGASKSESGVQKNIHSFIIYVDENPIGYIQIYNAYKFTKTHPLTGLPNPLMSLDFFIGEIDYIGKGIGAKALQLFLNYYGNNHPILVDPNINNIPAIKVYEKSGFIKIREHKYIDEIWMLKS